MGRQAGRIIFSLFLIALGVVALLSNLLVLPFNIQTSEMFWLLAFGAGGLAFVTVF